jgi:hypothetical protein
MGMYAPAVKSPGRRRLVPKGIRVWTTRRAAPVDVWGGLYWDSENREQQRQLWTASMCLIVATPATDDHGDAADLPFTEPGTSLTTWSSCGLGLGAAQITAPAADPGRGTAGQAGPFTLALQCHPPAEGTGAMTLGGRVPYAPPVLPPGFFGALCRREVDVKLHDQNQLPTEDMKECQAEDAP